MTLQVELALNGLGWHPGAWRLAGPDAHRASDPRYWAEIAVAAESAGLDAIGFEDSIGAPSATTNTVIDRLDAVLLASFVAPKTSHIGLFPTIIANHHEPFHHAKAIATLDFISHGRAGVRVRVAPTAAAAEVFGRRTGVDIAKLPAAEREAALAALLDEAADHTEVLRRLWDSWEDGAEIRDVSTGRFIDRNKLHYIDFESRWFSIKGPSIVPRPPQGQPPVSVLSHQPVITAFAALSADLIYVTPDDRAELAELIAEIRELEAAVDRGLPPLRILADIAVSVDPNTDVASARLSELNKLAADPLDSDALVFAGNPTELTDLIEDWRSEGLAGVRLRPISNRHNITTITNQLAPQLRERGLLRDAYAETILRDRYGLARPRSRYTQPAEVV